MDWSSQGIVVDSVTEKLNVLESKRGIVIVGAGVLARPKKEKEGNNDHVQASLDGCSLTAKIFGHVQQKVNGNGFDPVRRRILTSVATELAAQAKVERASRVFTLVFGPHAGHRLAHRADRVRNCARLDGETGGAKSLPVSGREDLEKRNGVTQVFEEWVDVEFSTELEPPAPVPISTGLSASNDATSDGLFTKAEVTTECQLGRTWCSSQGTGWG